MKLFVLFMGFSLCTVSCDDNDVNLNLECGQSSKLFDECFKDMSPKVTEFLSKVDIPISMEEINARCMIFQRGMKCVDDYVNKCIDVKQHKFIDNTVYGAKQFYKILCNRKTFQNDYLRHKECFHYIQNDWEKCSAQYDAVLKEELTKPRNELNANLQFMQICCAKYGYENCVFISAKYKCRKESAIFVREIAKILSSEKQNSNCDKIEKNVCSECTKSFLLKILILINFIILML